MKPDDTAASPPVPQIVLPRPNLGPEPWSSPTTSTPAELIVGGLLITMLVWLAVRKWRRGRAAARLELDQIDGSTALNHADSTPSHRLIASSPRVRAALITEFGPTWGARTTEEIARDPILTDRLGPAIAADLVAYLDRVDRAKFAGEELADGDQWIESARQFVARFPSTSRKPHPATRSQPINVQGA